MPDRPAVKNRRFEKMDRPAVKKQLTLKGLPDLEKQKEGRKEGRQKNDFKYRNIDGSGDHDPGGNVFWKNAEAPASS